MYISLEWLKDFIDIPKNITPAKLGELLTLHTVEVEGVKKLGENLDKIVVGKIVKLAPHPNADRLQLTDVSDGKKTYPIVCGGSNLRVGMLVALAKVGAQVRWHGQGDLVTMEAAVIRGEKSEGMICTAAEIGLADLFPTKDEREVIDLKESCKVGSSLAQALGLDDVIYDIDNKSMTHRPDLWSHYGMARDIAAVLGVKLKKYNPNIQIHPNTTNDNIQMKVKVEDTKLCPRYMAVAVEGIKIAPSPEWMQKRLLACGMRPINNVVDISNYVMLELGQPTHAFDRSRITTGKVTNLHQLNIIVRRAKKNERIKTLDEIERKLDENMLVIANEEMPLAVAGVMGGENSGIDEHTTSIVIESANFNPVSIRQTAQKLNLRTDASARFEKSLDPHLCEQALVRIVGLIKELIPNAQVANAVSDSKHFKLDQGPIKLDLGWLNKKIGADVKKSEVKKILQNLGFATSPLTPLLPKKRGNGGEVLSVKVPTWRATKDISIPEDLVEEIARVHGYNAIKPALPTVTMRWPEVNREREFRSQLKDALVQAGMTETYNYSFINEADLEKLGKTSEINIRLANPLTSEHTMLRNLLLPGLLRNVVTNQRQYDMTALFEIGGIFINRAGGMIKDRGKEKLPEQKFHIGAVYARKSEDTFSQLKGRVSYVFKKLRILDVHYTPTDKVSFACHGRAAEIHSGSRVLGYLFELDQTVARRCGVKTNVSVLELEIDPLYAASREVGAVRYQPKNKFPALIRDMAFVVDKKILYNDIREIILAVNTLIQTVEVFDVYAGKELDADKKNVAVHISFGSDEKTLTGEEVDTVQKEISAALQKKIGAQLRNF